MHAQGPLKRLHECINLAQEPRMAALCDRLIPHALQRRSECINILLQRGHLLFRPALELLGMLCSFMLPARATHPMML